MNTTNTKTAAVPEMQSALWGVALSLDAFVVNGISLGVIQSICFPGFLAKVAGNLTRDLDDLEAHAVSQGPAGTGAALLKALRANCSELVRLVSELGEFRTLPLPQLRSAVNQVRDAREECVQAIRELEAHWGTAEKFHQARPAQAAQAVNDFLVNLEQTFADERAAANAANEAQPLR
jgi:hypothetical protein